VSSSEWEAHQDFDVSKEHRAMRKPELVRFEIEAAEMQRALVLDYRH
jgi:hypothetical protein